MHSDIEAGVADGARPDVGLTLTVVRYTDRPDRCTVYPPEASRDARMSTWLTVDQSVCVDLDSVR